MCGNEEFEKALMRNGLTRIILRRRTVTRNNRQRLPGRGPGPPAGRPWRCRQSDPDLAPFLLKKMRRWQQERFEMLATA